MENTERIEILEHQIQTLSEQTFILTSALLDMLESTYKNSLNTSVKIGELLDKSLSLLISTGTQKSKGSNKHE